MLLKAQENMFGTPLHCQCHKAQSDTLRSQRQPSCLALCCDSARRLSAERPLDLGIAPCPGLAPGLAPAPLRAWAAASVGEHAACQRVPSSAKLRQTPASPPCPHIIPMCCADPRGFPSHSRALRWLHPPCRDFSRPLPLSRGGDPDHAKKWPLNLRARQCARRNRPGQVALSRTHPFATKR